MTEPTRSSSPLILGNFLNFPEPESDEAELHEFALGGPLPPLQTNPSFPPPPPLQAHRFSSDDAADPVLRQRALRSISTPIADQRRASESTVPRSIAAARPPRPAPLAEADRRRSSSDDRFRNLRHLDQTLQAGLRTVTANVKAAQDELNRVSAARRRSDSPAAPRGGYLQGRNRAFSRDSAPPERPSAPRISVEESTPR